MYRLYVYELHGERYQYMGSYQSKVRATKALRLHRRAYLTDDSLPRETPIDEVGCVELRKVMDALKQL